MPDSNVAFNWILLRDNVCDHSFGFLLMNCLYFNGFYIVSVLCDKMMRNMLLFSELAYFMTVMVAAAANTFNQINKFVYGSDNRSKTLKFTRCGIWDLFR
jgi:hypothetical protein